MSAAAEERTVLMTITATDSNPDRAAQIANSYAAVFPQYMAQMENVGRDPRVAQNPLATVVQTATPPTKSDGLPTSLLLLAGAVVGSSSDFSPPSPTAVSTAACIGSQSWNRLCRTMFPSSPSGYEAEMHRTNSAGSPHKSSTSPTRRIRRTL